VVRLQQQVQHWRRAKEGRFSISPEEFWDAAVPLAVQFEVCWIARAVGLDYGGLRKRVAEATGPSTSQPTFVELPLVTPQPQGDPAPESGLVIDISRPDGARMRISLKPGIDLDAAGIVEAFAGRGD
jgi:hypothetical protein